MPSANGYKLQVGEHELTAAWAAPYFVLDYCVPENSDEPLLIHCETLADAQRKAKIGTGGTILDHEFLEVSK